MLIRLTIKNYALIRHLELEPSPRLSVITGETGAGKSIMLGAVGLLLGNRADTKVLWNEAEKCVIEGVFDISGYSLKPLFEKENLDYEKQTVIRREISPAAKSRAFINDTPVTLEVLRQVGSQLMDVHSQHETLELGSRAFQLNLVDTYAAHPGLRDDYRKTWNEFVVIKNELDVLINESNALRQEADFINFQLNELVQAGLAPGEQEKLESEFKMLEHAEDIKIRLNESIALVNGQDSSIRSMLADVRTRLNAIAGYSPAFAQLYARVESLRIELDDIAGELEHEEGKADVDPTRSEKVKERLSLIYQLLQKHRSADVAQLLELQDSLQQKSDKTLNLDGALAAARAAVDKVSVTLSAQAKALSASRQKAVKPLCREIVGLLKELGIPDAQLTVEMESMAPSPSGIDSVEILFSANKGIEPRPLGQVASGGEFSRVMFAVKYVIAEKSSLPTLILDEIDSGVSGEIAIQLGKMMKAMAKRHQLITITHSPQIAARGDSHFYVFKDNSAGKTVSNIQQLNSKDRINEIAQMIGGAKPSALALENARELMSS